MQVSRLPPYASRGPCRGQDIVPGSEGPARDEFYEDGTGECATCHQRIGMRGTFLKIHFSSITWARKPWKPTAPRRALR